MTGAYFPDLGQIRPSEVPARKPKEPAAKAPTELELANKRADEAEDRERASNEALRNSVWRPAPLAPKVATAVAPAKPGKMPDPATQPAEFETWQASCRDWDRYENRQHVEDVRSTESSAAKSQRIIDEFMSTRPKYAPIRSHVFNCYHEAAVELGLSEIPDDTRELDALADKKITSLVNAAASAADLPGGDPNTEEAHRTGGLSAGSTGSTAGGASPEEEDGVVIRSLFDVQRERQAGSGLF
jgi:hypothetical protein